MVLAMVRFVMRSDDMQQPAYRIAAMIARVLTIALAFTWGFLESYAGSPPRGIFYVGMFGVLAWTFSAVWVKRRYR